MKFENEIPPTAFSLKKYPKKKEIDIKQITNTLKKKCLFENINYKTIYI